MARRQAPHGRAWPRSLSRCCARSWGCSSRPAGLGSEGASIKDAVFRNPGRPTSAWIDRMRRVIPRIRHSQHEIPSRDRGSPRRLAACQKRRLQSLPEGKAPTSPSASPGRYEQGRGRPPHRARVRRNAISKPSLVSSASRFAEPSPQQKSPAHARPFFPSSEARRIRRRSALRLRSVHEGRSRVPRRSRCSSCRRRRWRASCAACR